MRILKSKVTTFVLAALCICALTAAILVPVLCRKQIVSDTNSDVIGKDTVDWMEGGTFGNALSDDLVMVGNYDFGEDYVTHTDYGTAGAFDMIFYNKFGLLENYSFKATMKIDSVDVSAVTDYKMGFYPVFVNEVNRAEVCLIQNQDDEVLMSISLCNDGVWEKLWEVIPIPADTDLYEENEIETIKIGSEHRIYLNGQKVYEFTAPFGAAQVGFLSESTLYSATGISVSEASAFPTETLSAPELTIAGSSASWTDIAHAEGYEMSVNGGEAFSAQSPFALSAYFKESGAADGTYEIKVRAKGNGTSYLDSAWSNAVSFEYSASQQQLAAPVISVTDNIVHFEKVENASSYRLRLYVVSGDKDLFVAEVTDVTDGYDLTALKEEYCGADETYCISVIAAGDGALYLDSEESDKADFIGGTQWNNVKGAYTAGKNAVTLVGQETADGDNYAVGYDLIYASGLYTDVTVSANIRITDEETVVNSKAGIKIAADESKYFTAFVVGNTISLLSTLDGGMSWVQIWSGNYEISSYDAEKGVDLKLVKTGETIKVYANGALVHTESALLIGADTQVKVGFTSEAVSPVVYGNIYIGEEEGLTFSSAVKGIYDTTESGKLVLTEQQTADGDNYSAGYDLIYLSDLYSDFTVSANIKMPAEGNTFSKAGIKIAVDESKYFTAFVVGNKIVLLSTLDGGASWVQIWGGNYKIHSYDAEKGVDLRLRKTGEQIEVYANDMLVHTESGFAIGADTQVKIGFTSEAVSPVEYSNIVLTYGE